MRGHTLCWVSVLQFQIETNGRRAMCFHLCVTSRGWHKTSHKPCLKKIVSNLNFFEENRMEWNGIGHAFRRLFAN